MTPFVLDYCDTNHFVIHYAKKDQIGKSLHQCSPCITTNYHPAIRHGCNAKNLPFKFVDKIVTQITGLFVVVITYLDKLSFNRRMILNSHYLKRYINCSCEIAVTCPLSIS